MDTTETTPHTYEAIASGDIDIQQLLDNITANAEKNEAAAAAKSDHMMINQNIMQIPQVSHPPLAHIDLLASLQL